MTPLNVASQTTDMQKLNAIILTGLCLLFGCDLSAPPPIPAIVEGDSMAPTVCGDHLQVTCVECEFEFKAGVVKKADFKLACPNCGNRELMLADAAVVASTEVQLQPFSKFPRRWDVVGFELPDDAKSKTGIKRIVGLPGETIEFRDGDLYSNGNVLRKSWDLQKEVRVPVFDSKFNAIVPFDNSSRFRFDDSSGWEVRDSELRFSSLDSQTQWLDYIQWRNVLRVGKRDEAFPIEDSYGFNQEVVRKLNPTDDLMLQLDVAFENDSEMVLLFRRGQSEFEFTITRTEEEFRFQWEGESERKPLVCKSILQEANPQGLIEFSSFDQTLMLRINGTSVFELRENESSPKSGGGSLDGELKLPFRLGGSKGMFRIERFQLWRDLYYLPAPSGFEPSEDLKLTAGADEYILLGDNCPVSLDSRSWEKPGISRSKLIGRLVLPKESL